MNRFDPSPVFGRGVRWTPTGVRPMRAQPKILSEQVFPQWARPPAKRHEGVDAALDVALGAAFAAGAGLALLDQSVCAGALRQRLAPLFR